MLEFDDSRLEDAQVLREADRWLRPLAEAGARLRCELLRVESTMAALTREPPPRAIIAIGSQAELLRVVLEPGAPAPFVAWPRLRLPAWVGPLDLVLACGVVDATSLTAVTEAVRRGARLLVATAEDSPLAVAAASRNTTLLAAPDDPLTSAITLLQALCLIGVGAQFDIEAAADALDLVASECSPLLDSAVNPAKNLAIELAETQPLVWGGSFLAAYAARETAEALRSASGRIALAADSTALLSLLQETQPRDLFADPFEQKLDVRPTLLLLDDARSDDYALQREQTLTTEADRRGVTISRLQCPVGDRVTRYLTLLHQAHYGAAYLRIALSRD